MHSRAPVIDCPGEKIAERKRKRGGVKLESFSGRKFGSIFVRLGWEEAKRIGPTTIRHLCIQAARTSHLASSENGETSKKVSLVTTVSKANAQKEANAEAIDEVKRTESFVIRRGGGGGEGSKGGERKALWFRGIQIQ